jgi:tRNA threonylcarbamoyladenosine biosynthesis protein TsaE
MRGTVFTESPEDTFALGEQVGRCLREGDVVALRGELGVGKTCFTKGLARGLGVPDKYVVTSPSFTLINEYPGRISLYHVDVYRFSGPEELARIGYEEYFPGEGVTVIEWADKVMDLIPAGALVVDFFYLDDKRREIQIAGPEDLMKRLREAITHGGLVWH